MSVKPIISLPSPLLRQVSVQVPTVDAAILRLADDMLDTMYHAPGIGLAAIQIGEPVRLLVLDVANKNKDETTARDPQIFINPEIVWSSAERNLYEEGCLSIPDYYAEVERPKIILVRFVDRLGMIQEIKAEGLLATCLQHEIDHLDGVLFIDYLSPLKRNMVIRKFNKKARQNIENKSEELMAG